MYQYNNNNKKVCWKIMTKINTHIEKKWSILLDNSNYSHFSKDGQYSKLISSAVPGPGLYWTFRVNIHSHWINELVAVCYFNWNSIAKKDGKCVCLCLSLFLSVAVSLCGCMHAFACDNQCENATMLSEHV